jgi:geranylgeranyl pyrophosphate synthase
VTTTTNTRPAPEAPPTTLVDLLDQTFTDDALCALARAGVPRGAWESALLGPARDLLDRPGKRFRQNLVALCWKLAGGRGDVPSRLPLALEIIHTGSLIIDDVQDDSSRRRGGACLHRLHGVPIAINVGNWLYFWGLELAGELGLPAAVEAELRRTMNRAMFRCHFGQALDLDLPIGRTPQRSIPGIVAAATDLKTGSLMELCARAAAIAARAPGPIAMALAAFGRRLGVGLQMLDDLGNLNLASRAERAAEEGRDPSRADDKPHEDLRLGRPTWPWAWTAETMDEIPFAALQADACVVHAQALAGARPQTEPLAAALQAALGMRGRRVARVHLERAIGDLERVLGPAPELALVTSEIDRLEAAYG